MQRRMTESKGDEKELLVPLTSDKGMCGAINSGIIRHIRDYANTKNRENLQIFSIGGKGASAMKRTQADILRINVSEVATPYNYPTVMAMSEHIINWSEGSDKIVVFYNEYKSAISTVIRQMELMTR